MDLPKTNAKALPQEKEEPLTVNIDANWKGLYSEATEVGHGRTLLPKLTAIAEARESKKVYLRADASIDVWAVFHRDGKPESGRLRFGQHGPRSGEIVGIGTE